MSDFISPFWGYYVAVLVVGSFIFVIWLLAGNMTKKPAGQQVELQKHAWDENLQEWNNPLPGWWMYLFWFTIAFGIVYLILYPGFGTFGGKFGWTSVGQYKEERRIADQHFDEKFNQYKDLDLKAVAADPEAREMGKRLFLTYCQQCHGSDARGAKGFPNLTNPAGWQWGSEPDQIVATITQGHQAAMPAWEPQLGAEGVKDAANYVRSLSGLAHDSLRAERGKDIFAQTCSACHGPEGKGNPAMGAPNLTDKTWLYGSSEATLIETIGKGRNGLMPTWGPMLGDKKIKLLAAYVYGLNTNAQ